MAVMFNPYTEERYTAITLRKKGVVMITSEWTTEGYFLVQSKSTKSLSTFTTNISWIEGPLTLTVYLSYTGM